ncbi:YdcF family protein [Streptomyces sp. SID6673]|nr:YdcF family protein [Streptomyces sp. SID11726]NEB26971.1 YdcF family protein [Streptomyces sp. SID6673]
MTVELIITIAATWVYVSSSGRVLDEADVPAGSTALVLGSLVADGEPGDYVRGRLDTTVDLYRSGRVSRIINSGNGSAAAGDEPAVMRRYLEQHGVDADDIADDPLGMDTEASCRRAGENFGVTAAVIITQDFHLSRAIALCRHRGIDATGVAARCDCPTWTLLRNHVRELALARPRALLSTISGQ